MEAIRHITYLKNRTLHRALTENVTLYEAFTKKKPNLDGIQEFGTKCWVLNQTNMDKLMCKSHKATFVRYQGDGRIVHYWDGTGRRVQTSRDIVFEEPSAEESDDDTARPMQSQGEKQASIEEIQDTPAQNQRPTTPPPVTGITLSAVMQSPPPINKDEDPAMETEAELTEPKRSSHPATKPKLDYAKINAEHI